MPRQRRFSSRSSESPVSTIAISPAFLPSAASTRRTITRSGALSPRRLGGVATEIGIGAGAPPRIFGVRRAHVEDRRQHGNERLANAGQLGKREPALVELPFLHPLLNDAAHQAANAARRWLAQRA